MLFLLWGPLLLFFYLSCFLFYASLRGLPFFRVYATGWPFFPRCISVVRGGYIWSISRFWSFCGRGSHPFALACNATSRTRSHRARDVDALVKGGGTLAIAMLRCDQYFFCFVLWPLLVAWSCKASLSGLLHLRLSNFLIHVHLHIRVLPKARNLLL